jgi:hypothetical protein
MGSTFSPKKSGCPVSLDRRCGSIKKLSCKSRNLNIKLLPWLEVIDSLQPKPSRPKGHVHEEEI